MAQVDYFEASGGVLGADRRFRLQGVNLISSEALRTVFVGGGFATALFGDSSPLPTNLSALTVSVAFGQSISTPPVGDFQTNPTGEDWLAVWECTVDVLPRSINNTINGYELRISLAPGFWLAAPRIPFGAARSIWAVTTPLPPVQAGTLEWGGGLDLIYSSVRP